MQQAVLQHFPGIQGTYTFTLRDKNVYFTRECFNRLTRSTARESPHSCSDLPCPCVFGRYALMILTSNPNVYQNLVKLHSPQRSVCGS